MRNWTVENMPRQDGRIVLITGANSGLGYQMALIFAAKGARVIMACRNLEKGQAASDKIESCVSGADLDLRCLDLGSLDSNRSFAAEVLEDYEQLHILINNAGIMAVPRSETADGFEIHMGVNHLGHFALTGLLLPLILNTPGSRVISVSSVFSRIGRMHFDDLNWENGFWRYGAYSQSKLANILFANELQRRFEEAGIEAISLAAHPGYSVTNLQSTSTSHSGSTIEWMIYGALNQILAQSAEMGSLPELYAATSPDVRPGAFYGPRYFMRGYTREVRPPRAARKEADGRRLWRMSEELTGVTYEFGEDQGRRMTNQDKVS